MANYILPILSLPYLARVLGPAKFGSVSFAMAIAGYCVVLVDFGFNLSATRQVSIAKAQGRDVSRIVCDVYGAKILLMLLGLFGLLLSIYVVPTLREIAALCLLAFMTVIGNVLFPVWFFQGMEQMRFVAALSVFSRLLMLVALFLFVKDGSDYLSAVAIQSGFMIVAGLASIPAMHQVARIEWSIPTWWGVRDQLADGWHVFMATAAASLYTNSAAIALGFSSSSAQVGHYSGGERLIRASQSVFVPISNAVFPRLAALSLTSESQTFHLIRKVMLATCGAGAVVSLTALFGADLLVTVLLGPQYGESIPILRLLSPVPLLVAVSNVLGVQLMLNFGMKRTFTAIITMGGVLGLIAILALSAVSGARGAAIGVVLVEFAIALSMLTALSANGLLKRAFRTQPL